MIRRFYHKTLDALRSAALSRSRNTHESIETQLVLQSSLESIRRRSSAPPSSLFELEYRAFSQFGEDGIIDYLCSFIPSTHHRFVEFGVEDYQESNTRLLLQRENWSGLVIDSDERNVAAIMASDLYWRHDITALTSFITRDNIERLIVKCGFGENLGLLSIDVDGNDFWIWKAIDFVRPMIVVCEYNSSFGDAVPVSVPYDERFSRSIAHYSHLYFGASIMALCELATERGYRFVGCNRAGNNAFFVLDDLDIPLVGQTADGGYVKSKFREERRLDGTLTYRSSHEPLADLVDLPLVNTKTGDSVTVGSLKRDPG